MARGRYTKNIGGSGPVGCQSRALSLCPPSQKSSSVESPSSSSSFVRCSSDGPEEGVPPGEGHPHLPSERDYFVEIKMTTISNLSRALFYFRGYREVPRPLMELQGLRQRRRVNPGS